MRWLLMLALLAMTAWPVAAQENEAEKLFRDMEKNVGAAKTLQLRFDVTITGADAKRSSVKGTLVLGEADKLRMEAEGDLFGAEVKFTVVSDGIDTKTSGYTKAPSQPKQDKTGTEKVTKGVGAYFRGTLPRAGYFVCLLNIDHRSKLAPELVDLSDFKFAGKEKIGERDTQVIQYTISPKDKGKDRSVLSMKVWLDAKTNLPVKMFMTGGGADITDITETYSEFTINAKIDAMSFVVLADPPLADAASVLAALERFNLTNGVPKIRRDDKLPGKSMGNATVVESQRTNARKDFASARTRNPFTVRKTEEANEQEEGEK